MKVRFTSVAKTDLRAIGDYIAKDNSHRAATFIAEIEEKCMHLAVFPEAGPVIRWYPTFGLRKLVHGRYLILYRVEDLRIVIVRVVSGSRDLDALYPPVEDI